MAKGAKIPKGNPIKSSGTPSKTKKAGPPKTKSGAINDTSGRGAVPNTHR